MRAPGRVCSCDPIAGEALLAQTTNLVLSRELCARVDRLVTNAALQVDIANGGIDNLVPAHVGNFQTNHQLGPLLGPGGPPDVPGRGHALPTNSLADLSAAARPGS